MHALTWGRTLGSDARLSAIHKNQPYTPTAEDLLPIHEGQLTSEVVDLRLPPPPFTDPSRVDFPEAAAPKSRDEREAMAFAWAQSVLTATPPRLSLRDPLNPSDETKARRCDFNASGDGKPTMRLGCRGHVSWRVRHETQRQQSCTSKGESKRHSMQSVRA